MMDSLLKAIADNIWENLGMGPSESVYHRAFEVALRCEGIPYESERVIPIIYEGHYVGTVRADMIVGGNVVVELKNVAKLNEQYIAQTQNYLRLLDLSEGYLINFPTTASSGAQVMRVTLKPRIVNPFVEEEDKLPNKLLGVEPLEVLVDVPGVSEHVL